jgi:hypothetical protein
MAGTLTIHEAAPTDDGPALGAGPVLRWVVEGLPAGERADITESKGRWRIPRMRCGLLENDPRQFPSAEAGFAALVQEYAEAVQR